MSHLDAGANLSGHENRGTQAGQNFGFISGGNIHYYASSAGSVATKEPRGPLYLLPFARNRRFTGRAKELEELRSVLFVDGYCQHVAVTGLGGVGKTQLALELAYEVKATKSQCSIFWVPAISIDAWQQAFATIARLLELPTTATGGSTVEANVRDYLSREAAGEWLFIVDNADSADVVFGHDNASSRSLVDYLPQSTLGSILFTTRTLELATQLSGSEVIRLDEMSDTVAYDLLSKSLIDKTLLEDRTSVSNLMRELTYLPLAITQAAAYINSTQISILDYLVLLQDTEASRVAVLSRDFKDLHRYRESKNPVAATWLISFDRIRQENVLAADLLSFMSVLEPKNIPEQLLPKASRESRMYALGTLQSYSFITKRGNAAVYDLHRLVHLAAETWVETAGTLSQWRSEAMRQLTALLPRSRRDRYLAGQLLPHAQRIFDATGDFDPRKRMKLCANIGLALYYQGRYREAVQRNEEVENWTAKSLEEQDPERLNSQHELARAYRAHFQDKQAVKLMEHVVKVRDATLPEDDADRLRSQHELAGAYRESGIILPAIALLEHVVKVSKAILAEDNTSLLDSQHELACAYRANRQAGKAIELLEHVVKISNASLRETEYDRILSQSELAAAYEADGQLEKAYKLREVVVKSSRATLAEDEPERLDAEYFFAIICQKTGQAQRAVEILEHVLKIEAGILAEDDPWRARTPRALEEAKREAERQSASQLPEIDRLSVSCTTLNAEEGISFNDNPDVGAEKAESSPQQGHA